MGYCPQWSLWVNPRIGRQIKVTLRLSTIRAVDQAACGEERSSFVRRILEQLFDPSDVDDTTKPDNVDLTDM